MVTSIPELQLRMPSENSRAPLEGCRVVDFTRVMAGPFGTQILGDLGAEVIKIEHPATGDETRSLGLEASRGGESAFFMAMNRSKLSVTIDLKSSAGRGVALDLIGKADVLIDNFTGGVMRRFKLDYPSLRTRFPQLIYCSVSAYGRSGSNTDSAGYDTPVGAEAGLLGLNAWDGEAPVQGALPYTDISTALNATIGILAALHARVQYGLGQHVDVAMFDSALANLSFRGCEFLVTGRETQRYRPQSPMPTGLFDTAQGQLSLMCGNDRMFRALCTEVLGRPELALDPRFSVTIDRIRNGELFLAELQSALKERSAEEWAARCKRAGVPCGALRTPGEALLSPEAVERELVFSVPHPKAGAAPAIAQPIRFSETPCRYGAPPYLGQHTAAVLSGLLGYSEAQIEALASAGAIGVPE